jgi:predicted transcriptional regulator
MVNWDSNFTDTDASRRGSGEPLAWHEAQPAVFATKLVAKEVLLSGEDGQRKLDAIRKHLKGALGVGDGNYRSAWQDLFDIEQILSRAEAVRLVPMR